MYEGYIMQSAVDIVIPRRNKTAFDTYPQVQADAEQYSNYLANKMLRDRGINLDSTSDIDFWIGMRLFRNDPDLVRIFKHKYQFRQSDRALYQIVDPEIWANALFLPVVMALHEGYRVVNVETPKNSNR